MIGPNALAVETVFSNSLTPRLEESGRLFPQQTHLCGEGEVAQSGESGSRV
jgi:hypothetical protein